MVYPLYTLPPLRHWLRGKSAARLHCPPSLHFCLAQCVVLIRCVAADAPANACSVPLFSAFACLAWLLNARKAAGHMRACCPHMVYRGMPQCSHALPYSGCQPLQPGLHIVAQPSHTRLSSTCVNQPVCRADWHNCGEQQQCCMRTVMCLMCFLSVLCRAVLLAFEISIEAQDARIFRAPESGWDVQAAAHRGFWGTGSQQQQQQAGYGACEDGAVSLPVRLANVSAVSAQGMQKPT